MLTFSENTETPKSVNPKSVNFFGKYQDAKKFYNDYKKNNNVTYKHLLDLTSGSGQTIYAWYALWPSGFNHGHRLVQKVNSTR